MNLCACWLPLLLLAVLPNGSQGCSIPVFRYALERWPPAHYEVVVFHRDGLPQATQDLLARFEEPTRGANVTLTSIDVSGKIDKPYQQLWEKNKAQTLPCLVVRFPEADDKAAPLWTGPVTEDAVLALLDSPVRRKLADQLTRGDSAVFLLLTGESKDADEAAEKLLHRELARLEQKITLPEQSKDGPQLTSNVPLKVSFPLLVLPRETAAERLLVQMLLHGEEDLSGVKGPIVFPILGRGRMLCSFHGDDLKAERVEEAARFLCGACSCRVKELNPGVDLLLAADWQERLSAASSPGTVEAIAAPQVEPTPPSLPAPPSETPGATEASTCCSSCCGERRDRTGLWIAIAVTAGLVLATGVWASRTMRAVKLP